MQHSDRLRGGTPWAKKRAFGASMPPTKSQEVEVQSDLNEVKGILDKIGHVEDTMTAEEEALLQEAIETEDLCPLEEPPAIIPVLTAPKLNVIPKRRPNYRHELIGLSIGDRLIFQYHPTIEARIEDLNTAVSIGEVQYPGIDAAASAAYTQAGKTPPKRVNGLTAWRTQTGERLNKLYEKVQPVNTVPNTLATVAKHLNSLNQATTN